MKMYAGDEQYDDDVTLGPASYPMAALLPAPPANPPVTQRGVVATVADWHDKAAVSEEVLVGYTDRVSDYYPIGQRRFWKEASKGAQSGQHRILSCTPKYGGDFHHTVVEFTSSPAQVMVRVRGDRKREQRIEARDIRRCYKAADSERFLDRYGLALDEAERTFVTQQIESQQATEHRERERKAVGAAAAVEAWPLIEQLKAQATAFGELWGCRLANGYTLLVNPTNKGQSLSEPPPWVDEQEWQTEGDIRWVTIGSNRERPRSYFKSVSAGAAIVSQANMTLPYAEINTGDIHTHHQVSVEQVISWLRATVATQAEQPAGE